MAELGIRTRAIRFELGAGTSHKVVMPPIHLSTNCVFAAPGESGGYGYPRTGNPTRDLPSDALVTLEGGVAATVVATGPAAVTLLVEELVPVSGVVACQHDCYGGTWRLLSHHATRGYLKARFIDSNDPEVFKAPLNGVSMVLAEAPSNPLLWITDSRAVVEAAHVVGAQLAVDNTFCSSLLQRPIDLGADYVLHSTTEFVNGHSDVVGGAVVIRDSEIAEHAGWLTNILGLTAGTFDPYLTSRGLRTLDVRIRMHVINTGAVVDAAQGHPAIAILYWPRLEIHPGHELTAKQQFGFGSPLSIDLVGGCSAAERLLQGLQVFHLTESLGGVESLICHPATMAHAGTSPEARAVAGIGDGLLCLSVGLEAAEDLAAAITEILGRTQGRGELAG